MLNLSHFIGSTSSPTGTRLKYQIDGDVLPATSAKFLVISDSVLQLEGSLKIGVIPILNGQLEIIDNKDNTTVTLGYKLSDGNPFVTMVFIYHVSSDGKALNLTRYSSLMHKHGTDEDLKAAAHSLMTIKTAQITTTPNASSGTDTQLEATSDSGFSITTVLVPA